MFAIAPGIALAESATTGAEADGQGLVPGSMALQDSSEAPETWSALANFIANAEDNATITLTQDYKAESGDGMLKFPEGKTVTLDLNGYTLDRNLAAYKENGGSVIFVPSTATVTIKSGVAGSGKITGGYANYGGGINNQGVLTLEDVVIAENRAMLSGGIQLSGNATLNLRGGLPAPNPRLTFL